MLKKQKVLAAMSGGVDSSIAAALLLKQSFSVKGVHFRLTEKDSGEKKAKIICRFLKIPFKVVDSRKEFQQKVVKPFLSQYQFNLTPNPCVICNPEIKFSVLNRLLVKEKADFFATGHYVRIKRNNGVVSLLKGKDKEKDQSYFLWRLSQNQLKKAKFPLGDYKKSEVKLMAKKIGLPYYGDKNENKIEESQEICFAEHGIECFLKQNLTDKPGRMVDDKGNILGDHRGMFFYTLGQRKGLGLSGGPYFVLRKDAKKNQLVLTKEEKKLLRQEFLVKRTNWLLPEKPKMPLTIRVKTRYRQRETAATIFQTAKKGTFRIVLKRTQRAITPGQSAVFYKGEQLIGGGIIKN